MKRKVVHLFLLLSLLFNVAHAITFTLEEKVHGCHHHEAGAFIIEQTQNDGCGDICDLHPLFHFVAIVETTGLLVANDAPARAIADYTPPTFEILIHKRLKPPIL